ncbi:helix-turn-helix domain-containing protein [Weissella ceti]|uniref:Helix-turn-helix domain-containing protein n=1 Tax=Weissella ceti TaxID=759620 RepID=A0ABT3E5S1_9LACO|nr:hypothetical protein [Weissella ceti]MCW0953757.1 helix-turn-helix domain-containing protein [Weissella ceti]QVK11410.1 helix-turn-helix domain-containing protein [Weissella ceti]
MAKLTRKSINTVTAWERQGKLHATIGGGRKLFDLDEVNALIRPNNKHSRNTYLMADIPSYDDFIDQVATDAATKLKNMDR